MSGWFYNSFEDSAALNTSNKSSSNCYYTPTSSYAPLLNKSFKTTMDSSLYILHPTQRDQQKISTKRNSNDSPIKSWSFKKQKLHNMEFSLFNSPYITTTSTKQACLSQSFTINQKSLRKKSGKLFFLF